MPHLAWWLAPVPDHRTCCCSSASSRARTSQHKEAAVNLLGRKRPRRALLGLFAAVATVAASLGMAGSAGGAGAEGVGAAEGPPTSISGSSIVVLKDGVTAQAVPDQATGLAARFGGK